MEKKFTIVLSTLTIKCIYIKAKEQTNKKVFRIFLSVLNYIYIYVGSFVFGIEIIFKKDIYG
jgi:hypothetical protein